MSWAQGNEEPHKAAVRASVVAQASREAARTSRTDRRRVTTAGAKGRRKMDRDWNGHE
jgi:hypothetical protein